MAFDFSGFKATNTKKNIKTNTVNFIIMDHYNEKSSKPYVVFIIDRLFLSFSDRKFIEVVEDLGCTNYTVLYAFNVPLHFNQKIEGAVKTFVVNNRSKCLDWLETSGRNVDALVPFGQALYLITNETGRGSLETSNFYNYIFGQHYFYWGCVEGQLFPNHIETHIFPVDSVDTIFPIDPESATNNLLTCECYRTNFLRKQVEFIINNYGRFYTPPKKEIKMEVIKTVEGFNKFIEEHMNSPMVAWDTETTSFDYTTGDFICHTFAFDEITGYYVDWDCADPQKIIKLLNSCKEVWCANGKYDTKWLWYKGIKHVDNNGVITYKEDPESFYPTDGIDLLAHCLDTSQLKGLGPLSWFYTTLGGYWNKLDEYKDRAKIKSYADIPKNILESYAAYDAVATFRVALELQKIVKDIDKKFINDKDYRFGVWDFYKERVTYSYPNWIDLEYKGVYVNKEFLIETRDKLEKEINEILNYLLNLWKDKQTFIKEKNDIYSATKLGKAFMEMGFETVPVNKAGIFKTDEECLAVWERNGREGIKELQRLKHLVKCLTTFIGASSEDSLNIFTENEEDELESENGWLTLLRYHPEDNSYRLHPAHNFMGTATLRDSCTRPNLQQLTSKGEFAHIVLRNMWVEDAEKYVMLTCDYSSLQARIILQDTYFNSIHSPDPGLLNVYGVGGSDDLHSQSSVGFFEGPTGGQVLDVEDEQGSKYIIGGKQIIKVIRNGKEQEILALDLLETDTLIPEGLKKLN